MVGLRPLANGTGRRAMTPTAHLRRLLAVRVFFLSPPAAAPATDSR
jgi:hypothetical protein